ncbi:MAG: hypothetical protein IK141_02715, partial [Clostridia bacterium]|nr:hypothetical protein [Clostridia bacterium]
HSRAFCTVIKTVAADIVSLFCLKFKRKTAHYSNYPVCDPFLNIFSIDIVKSCGFFGTRMIK